MPFVRANWLPKATRSAVRDYEVSARTHTHTYTVHLYAHRRCVFIVFVYIRFAHACDNNIFNAFNRSEPNSCHTHKPHTCRTRTHVSFSTLQRSRASVSSDSSFNSFILCNPFIVYCILLCAIRHTRSVEVVVAHVAYVVCASA